MKNGYTLNNKLILWSILIYSFFWIVILIDRHGYSFWFFD